MAKALPKAWFVNIYAGSIKLRKVDKWAKFFAQAAPYFDSYQEAHSHLLSEIEKKLTEINRDAAHYQKVLLKAARMGSPLREQEKDA